MSAYYHIDSVAGSGQSSGKIIVKSGTPRRGILHPYAAAMLLNDSIGDGEAQPGAFTRSFGGKERLEYLADNIIPDSRPGVFELKNDVFGNRIEPAHYGHLPLAVHGSAGIDDQVRENLL